MPTISSSAIISSASHLHHHSTSKSFKTQFPYAFKLNTSRSQNSLGFQHLHLISNPRQAARLFSVAEETPVAVGTPDPSSEAARRLYVGNIPRTTKNDELQKVFEEHGAVEKVEVMYDKYSGRSRRFGFVTMKTADDANAATEKLNGTEIGGRKIKVNITEKPWTGVSVSPLQAEETAFVDSPYKLYVGNLAKTVTSDSLKSFFAEKGNVLGAKVSRVPGTSKSSGFGFVMPTAHYFTFGQNLQNAAASLITPKATLFFAFCLCLLIFPKKLDDFDHKFSSITYKTHAQFYSKINACFLAICFPNHSMALPTKLPSSSASTASPSITQFKKPQITHRPSSSLHFTKPSCSASPFTEKHSTERYQRDKWVFKNQLDQTPSENHPNFTTRDYEIALQLPELKNLLQVLREKREKSGVGKEKPGNVFLVGTGPGDPELLTLKALKVIQKADLLLYDRLVSNDVLDLVGPGARLLYVGKTAGYHSRTQEEIHELLLSFAEVGANVVRLKGGDPLVFGRGGEEMDFLQQQGIQVKVIPGITAASGIAAELGIPLTHRGVANSVRFLTGHSRKGGADPLFVAENAADPDSTLVVYMGLSTLPSLVQKLIHHGLPPDTPAAAIERGTTPQQRIVLAELKDLADKIASEEFISPTLIFIGKVVALSHLWPRSCSKETSCLITHV